VLLRPLPYDHPETLARVLVRTPGLATDSTESSGGLFVFFRERSRSFAALGFYYESEGVMVTDGDHPEHLTSALISPNVLDMVGAHPAAGRLFRDEDTRARPVPVMISHDVWVRRFGSDPDVSGKTIELNRDRRAIVGVLPRGFDFPSPSVGIWYPEGVSATRAGLNFRDLNVLGRLRTGVSAHAAGLELGELASHISKRFPEISAEDVRASGLSVSVETLKEAVVAPVRAELMLLGIIARDPFAPVFRRMPACSQGDKRRTFVHRRRLVPWHAAACLRLCYPCRTCDLLPMSPVRTAENT
jgi:hypothetical protein